MSIYVTEVLIGAIGVNPAEIRCPEHAWRFATSMFAVERVGGEIADCELRIAW